MIEPVPYNAVLAITGPIRGSSHEKLYQKLGFEILHDSRTENSIFIIRSSTIFIYFWLL